MLIKNLNELNDFAVKLAENIKDNSFLGLIGNLGSGKTQFAKFFVKALGGDIEEVVSPTFTILNEYITPLYRIFHFDLYRLNNIEELEEIGYKDFFYSDKIVIVEWIDKIPDSIPNFAKIIKFEIIDERQRKLEILEYGGFK